MQINSVSPSQVIFAPAKTTSNVAENPAPDQAMLNISAETFSSLVQQASAEPEVRQDVVAHFKAQIAGGSYPPVDIVAGLTHLLGAGVYQMATSKSSGTASA